MLLSDLCPLTRHGRLALPGRHPMGQGGRSRALDRVHEGHGRRRPGRCPVLGQLGGRLPGRSAQGGLPLQRSLRGRRGPGRLVHKGRALASRRSPPGHRPRDLQVLQRSCPPRRPCRRNWRPLWPRSRPPKARPLSSTSTTTSTTATSRARPRRTPSG